MSDHHHHDQLPSGARLGWTIAFNLAITIAEFVGGLVSGYLALTADAVHNLSDVVALILAWLGAKGAVRPSTKRSTYGLKRLEVITALISAMSLVVISVFIFQEAYRRLIDPQEISNPVLFMTVAVIGLIGNVVSVWLLHAERGKDLNMKAAFLHMAYDALSSLAVIIGGIVIILTGFTLIDAFLAVLIGIMILYSSYQVIKEAVLVLLEAVPARIDPDEVKDAIAGVRRVRSVHHLHIWSLSSNEIALSCHICLDEKDFIDGPIIIDQINQILHDRFDIGHATIQAEKFDCETLDLFHRRNHSE
ncbi:MAG TPA: cation diffusion facilitator family transporter [candidate division Zixibacteria bacterium]|nr:cation diffusion facilitator family transporter [candidate division Zixibacteria bacterium]